VRPSLPFFLFFWGAKLGDKFSAPEVDFLRRVPPKSKRPSSPLSSASGSTRRTTKHLEASFPPPFNSHFPVEPCGPPSSFPLLFLPHFPVPFFRQARLSKFRVIQSSSFYSRSFKGPLSLFFCRLRNVSPYIICHAFRQCALKEIPIFLFPDFLLIALSRQRTVESVEGKRPPSPDSFSRGTTIQYDSALPTRFFSFVACFSVVFTRNHDDLFR